MDKEQELFLIDFHISLTSDLRLVNDFFYNKEILNCDIVNEFSNHLLDNISNELIDNKE